VVGKVDEVDEEEGSSEGLTQFPAPPRPVCAYSGGGCCADIVFTSSSSLGWDWDSRSFCLLLVCLRWDWEEGGGGRGKYRWDIVF
jgi:hypothetical protein